MFDGMSVAFIDRRSDAPHALETPPWQLVVLLFCYATLSIVLAILYPDVFGTAVEHF
jgi:hypothetical protein